MKKKYTIKKEIKILLFFIFILLLINQISTIFQSKSYSIEYKIDKYNISENFDKDTDSYFYRIKYNSVEYEFVSNKKYVKEKKLIEDINEYNDGEYTCLVIKSDYIKTNPLCSKKELLIDFHLIPLEMKYKINNKIEQLKQINEKYQNYTIYNNDNDILIWNYKGFNFLKDKKIHSIEIFDKDIYDVPIIAKIGNYILIPDYEQNYSFDNFYIISLKDKKATKWSIKYEISFDSYILGTNENSIYLVDRQNKIEYEIVPHKQKMRIVGTEKKKGIIYENGSFNKISLNKLISSDYTFKLKKKYNYFLVENKLYLSYLDSKNKTLISDNLVTNIISSNEDEVFYLVEDTLYKYDLKYGETKVLKYSEWEFNHINKIIIDN